MTNPAPRPLPKPERLGELWRFDGYGSLTSQRPLLAAGDRLVGVAGSTLFAVDIYHMKEPVPDAQVAEQGFPYTFKSRYGDDPYVTAAGGVVYFMDGSELTALRLSDGQPLQTRNKAGKLVDWTPPTLDQVSGLFAANDKIIAIHIGELGETVVSAFVAVNGEPAFGPVVISDLSPGQVAYGEGAVFFVADGRLHAVNVDFGDKRFAATGGGKTTEPLSPSAAPCVARDVVAAVGTKLHFFDVKTGAEVFTPIAPKGARDVWSTPILADKGNLVIASNSSEVVAVRTSNGTVAWRTSVKDAGAPTLIPGHVLVTTDARRMLATLSLATGDVMRRMELPEIASDLSPVVTNETVFIPDVSGSLEGRPFARQHAAFFDGKNSCIDVEADQGQFDFGIEDFTIEAWIRSSEGGEIVSSHVTEKGSKEHGFRLNLGENGELRVAIVDATTKRVHAGRTRETHANDGEWHHVALIRRDHALLALLDGKSLEVFFREDSQAGLSIGGKSALTIGASRAAAGKPAEHHFNGLIRELRIWDRALDVATVQNNRHVKLTGNEPRLKGLWSLSEIQKPGAKKDPVNAVARHGAKATFNNAASAPTDLTLDNSGFPYLLHEVQGHWPYAGTWAARGELPINTAAALTSGTIAFGTNNALYGVRRADGRRLWQVDMPGAASPPVGDGGRFFVLTSDDGLIGVNAANGEYARVDAFAGFMKPTSEDLAAPAITSTHIAAGSPAGGVRIVDRLAEPVGVRDVTVPAPVRQLAFGDKHLYVLCGAQSALQIVSIDLASGARTAHPVSGSALAAVQEWVFCVRDGKLTRVTGASGNALQASSAITGAITGVAARRDRDLVVVGTDKGEVHGFAMSDLSRRWTVTLPAGRAKESHALFQPVFDHGGRICCTTTSGTVAILDPDTGARVGLYIESQGVVTPAMFSAATAYYGCTDPVGVDAYRDGALHSVVFGDTMVLRLGLDERGAPSRAEPHAVVDIQTVDADKHTLQLMDPSRSCIEAWVNVPSSRVNSRRRPGGGVLGICPTEAGKFDVNLEVDETGRLHYSARALKRGKWKMLRVDADTALGDGAWHHIAVSRDGEQSVTVYVDGVPVKNPAITLVEEAPAHTVKGLKAYLGAVAGADLRAVKPFCGMIADVRVWDTFLEPAEISARMHVKLRGSEPDLLAFWNFDRQNAQDQGPDLHHGTIVGAAEQPIWWLSDLAFEKPAYPYVTTSGKVYRDVPGEPRTYEVTCTVHRADGSAMAGQPMDFWYARNRDDHPTEVMFGMETITGVRAAEEPEPGVVFPDGRQRVFSRTSGHDGSVTFFVTPTRLKHTPTIDLRAGFMARHERFHVNVLLDEQKLAPPTPPSLNVQSKLIQDYSYSSGGTIDENRDRSTWRTVIRATNPDGTLRVGEPVSLWSEEQTTIQVAGRSYAINKENSAELVTDSQGEVVVVSDAGKLTAPRLMARAGFMHRNDRLVIAPDQDLHRTLSDVRGSDFTKPRTTRWNPNMKEGEGGAPLLSADYAPHADKVADAITTVMAAAKPADPQAPAQPRGDAHLLRSKARRKTRRRLRSAERLLFDAEPMRQPEQEPGSDRVVTFRTMAHAPRVLALNPDATRAELDDNAGFVFEVKKNASGKNKVRFEMLETRAEVDKERGTATPQKPLLRGWLSDLWDDIKDTATDIYENAVKIVVSIANSVEVAIHKLVDGVMSVVHTVVNSVVEAVNAVAGFFEQIGVMIMKAIEFLRALFNWKAILATKRILSDVFIASIDSAKAALQPARVEAAFLPLLNAGVVKPKRGGTSVNGETAAAGDTDSQVLEQSRGVQGQMVMQKSREGNMTTTTSGDGGPKPKEQSSPFDDLASGIPAAIPGLLDLSPAEMVEKLLALVKAGMDAGVRLMIKTLSEISGVLVEGIDWVMKVLRTEIRIPFLSELYKWITGDALTLLDLICLALAVPVHVAHIAITTIMGKTRTFAEDNAGLVARMKAAEGGKRPPRVLRADPVPVPKVRELVKMDVSSETLFIVLRSINLGAGLVSDAMFTKTVSAGGFAAASPTEARVRGFVKVIKGASGILASYVQMYESTPKSEARLIKGLKDETWNAMKPEDWMPKAIFGVLVAGDAITFLGGAKQVFSPSLPQPLSAVNAIEGDWIDKGEALLSLGAAIGCIGLVWKRTVIYQGAMSVMEQEKEDKDLVMMVRMYYIRDISMIVARIPWFMFTQTGANRMRKTLGGAASLTYGIVTGVRAAAGGVALATHVLAAYKYGQTT